MSETERTWTTGDTEEAYKAAEQRLRSRLVLKPWPQCPACKLNMELRFIRKEIFSGKPSGRRDLEVESVFDCGCWREEKAQEKKAEPPRWSWWTLVMVDVGHGGRWSWWTPS